MFMMLQKLGDFTIEVNWEMLHRVKFCLRVPGQRIRSKIDSFQNANFFILQPNPMMLPLIGIVSERRFQ